jgi:hypothetical protein
MVQSIVQRNQHFVAGVPPYHLPLLFGMFIPYQAVLIPLTQTNCEGLLAGSLKG